MTRKQLNFFCVKVILKIDNTTSVVVSAAISVGYTLIGGMISVAYTDVFQLFFIGFGLVSKPGAILALKKSA
jgi:high affinity choline transporter 7